MVNVAVVWGVCSTEPEVRELDSGRRLASLSIRVKTGDEPATSVPVTVWEPPAWVETVTAGDELVVIGHIRRRFFQTAAGGRGAKVEVEAESLARGGDRRRVAAVRKRVERAADALA